MPVVVQTVTDQSAHNSI